MSLLPYSNCGHHFSDDGPTGNYRIRHGKEAVRFGDRVKSGYHPEKEVRETCEHEGCNASRTEWRGISGRVEARHSKVHESGTNRPFDRDEIVRTGWFSSERVAREELAAEITADSGVRLE